MPVRNRHRLVRVPITAYSYQFAATILAENQYNHILKNCKRAGNHTAQSLDCFQVNVVADKPCEFASAITGQLQRAKQLLKQAD